MGFYLQCFKDDRGLLGTENQTIFHLKTLQGVLNRVRKYNLNHGKDYKISSFTNFHNDNTFKVVYEHETER